MSLLAAILNQTTKILSTVIGINSNTSNIQASVENGMTTQGYTTGRAPNLDDLPTINTNTQPAAIASDVQTGLTTQGYTTGRAGNLDNLTNLNATVSSRRKAYTTKRVAVTVGSFSTILSATGPGVLHAFSGISGGGVTVTITIDSVLVTTLNSPSTTPVHAASDGNAYSDSGTTILSSSLQWEFTSSLLIQTAGSGCTATVFYAN